MLSELTKKAHVAQKQRAEQERQRCAVQKRMSDQEIMVQEEIFGALERDFGINLDLC